MEVLMIGNPIDYHMSHIPSVTVIIPAYNRADTIAPVITSVIRQTHPVSEIIVIDDGSTDGTDAVIRRSFRENHTWPGRLVHLSKPNGGKSSALNMALPNASSEWIAFNDSDDLWLPDKLEKQFKTLERFPHCKACFTDTLFGYQGTTTTLAIAGIKPLDDAGIMKNLPLLLASRSSGIMMQTLMVHSEVMRAFGSFDTRLTVSQDTDLLFRLSLLTDFCYVNEPLVLLDREESRTNKLTRSHPTSNPARLEEDAEMHAKWKCMASSAEPALIQALHRRHISMLSALSNSYLLCGDHANAVRCMKLAYDVGRSPKLQLKWWLMRFLPGLTKRLIQAEINRGN
jgi:glycosyltransferase involved in cell wall biosynthesis